MHPVLLTLALYKLSTYLLTYLPVISSQFVNSAPLFICLWPNPHCMHAFADKEIRKVRLEMWLYYYKNVKIKKCRFVVMPAGNWTCCHSVLMSLVHLLHPLLPQSSTASQHYNLRHRAHSLQLPEHLTQLLDSNFLTRMLYKNTY